MSELSIRGLDGGTVEIDAASIESLKQAVGGSVLRAGDEGYEKARAIWNAMIDRKPALIVRAPGRRTSPQASTSRASTDLLAVDPRRRAQHRRQRASATAA